MSLALPKLKCALCGGAVDVLDDFFRASGDFLPAKDPLVPFCNVPLHWSCYAQWPERTRFAQAYVEAWIRANRKNPFWWSVYRDEQVYVSVNPERSVEEVSVRLCTVGSDIRVPLTQWAAWLDNAAQLTPGLRPLEQEALAAVLPVLRKRFPDDHAVVHAIVATEKQPPAPKRSAERKSRAGLSLE